MVEKRAGITILTIVVLYLYLYNPILKSGLAFGPLLILLSVIYTVINPRAVSRCIKLFKTELVLSITIALYVFFACLSNNGEAFPMLKTLFIWILFSTIVPVFFVECFLSHNNKGFWEIVIEIGFIASIISCTALLFPSFNDFLRNIQMEIDTRGGVLEGQLKFRGFGFAYYLSSSYGFVQGLMASLCLLRFDKKHIRYIIYFITITFSIIINARTGLFPIAFTLVYFALRNVLKFKIGKIIKYSLIALLLYYIILQLLSFFPDILDFIADFFDQLGRMFIDEEFEDSAYSRMLVFPNTTAGLLFGEGHDIFGDNYAIHSDIGYINQIFIGGLIFAGALILFELIVFIHILRRSEDKVFPTIFFLSILLFNYKGGGFYNINAYIQLWMIYYYVLVHNHVYPKNPIKIN